MIFTINPNGNEMPSKPKSPSKQNSLENCDQLHSHHSNHHYHYPLRPGSGPHLNQHHQPNQHPPHYGVGQDPNKIREKILSEFLRKRLRKCGLTQTFNEIRQVKIAQKLDSNFIRIMEIFLLHQRFFWIHYLTFYKLYKSIAVNDLL